jgi:hypothetical protein
LKHFLRVWYINQTMMRVSKFVNNYRLVTSFGPSLGQVLFIERVL